MRTLYAAAMTIAALSATRSACDAQNRGRRPDRDQQTQPRAFEWSGELSQGQRLILRSLNGSVSVERAAGRTLEVIASKTWRRGNPADVKIDATRANGGADVVVCARWTANTQCDATHYSMSTNGSSRDNDTAVEFIIKLPAGANASLNTTNGSIEVLGASGSIEANTTNGEIISESSDGPVRARTTNGSIEVRMMKLPSRGASYRTTNGSITITLPEGADANVEARTTLGRVQSDFAVQASGSGIMSPRRITGTIGKGGPLLEISTTIGSIRIEKK